MSGSDDKSESKSEKNNNIIVDMNMDQHKNINSNSNSNSNINVNKNSNENVNKNENENENENKNKNENKNININVTMSPRDKLKEFGQEMAYVTFRGSSVTREKGSRESKSDEVTDSDVDLKSLDFSDEEIIDLDTIANNDLLASNEDIRNTRRAGTYLGHSSSLHNASSLHNSSTLTIPPSSSGSVSASSTVHPNMNTTHPNHSVGGYINPQLSSSSHLNPHPHPHQQQSSPSQLGNKTHNGTTTIKPNHNASLHNNNNNKNNNNNISGSGGSGGNNHHHHNGNITIGGRSSYIISYTKTLRIHIDEKQYVTIPVTTETTVKDAIDFIFKKKAFDMNQNQIFFFIDEKLQPLDTKLYSFLENNNVPHTFEIQMKPNYSKVSDVDEGPVMSPRASPTSPAPKFRNRDQAICYNLSIFSQITVTHVDDDAQNSQALKHAEENLKILKDQEFKVYKLGFFGRKQERVLKLTRNGMENIEINRNGVATVTSFHTWENVKTSCLVDHETIQISYKDRKEDRIYKGPNVSTINDAIQERLTILKYSKTAAQQEDMSKRLHRSLLQKQILSSRDFQIGDKVRLTRDRVGVVMWIGEVDFAPNKHYGIELSEGQGDPNAGKYFTLRNNAEGAVVPDSQIIRKVGKNQASNALNGGVPSLSSSQRMARSGSTWSETIAIEDVIFREIKNSILRNDTTEGRSRNNFMSKWNKYAKSEKILSTVREFMNALKEYIINKKGEDFRRRIWQQMQATNNKNADNVSTGGIESSTDSDNKTQSDQEAAPIDPLTLLQINDTINGLVESAIEQTVLQSKLIELTEICEEMTRDETRVLKAKIVKLIKADQSFFGIKPSFQNNDNWRGAVYQLSLFRDCLLPSEKMGVLVTTARAIYEAHDIAMKEKEEKTGVPRKDDSFITGDDLLPIVIYVLVNASKNEPVLTDKDLMILEALVDPQSQRSEPGYYFTVFHAATQWIAAYQ